MNKTQIDSKDFLQRVNTRKKLSKKENTHNKKLKRNTKQQCNNKNIHILIQLKNHAYSLFETLSRVLVQHVSFCHCVSDRTGDRKHRHSTLRRTRRRHRKRERAKELSIEHASLWLCHTITLRISLQRVVNRAGYVLCIHSRIGLNFDIEFVKVRLRYGVCC